MRHDICNRDAIIIFYRNELSKATHFKFKSIYTFKDFISLQFILDTKYQGNFIILHFRLNLTGETKFYIFGKHLFSNLARLHHKTHFIYRSKSHLNIYITLCHNELVFV